ASFYPHFFLQPPSAVEVKVCGDICCHLRGAAELTATLQARYSRDPDLRLTTTSCLGQCERGPALMVNETVLAANGTGDLLDRVEHQRGEGAGAIHAQMGLQAAPSAAKFNFDPYAGESDYQALL